MNIALISYGSIEKRLRFNINDHLQLHPSEYLKTCTSVAGLEYARKASSFPTILPREVIESLPTAKEGNVFRSVCHSVHRGVCIQGGSASRVKGGWADPPLGLPRRPLRSASESGSQVMTSSGGHCSSRYTSYWNAFLLPPATVVGGR